MKLLEINHVEKSFDDLNVLKAVSYTHLRAHET